MSLYDDLVKASNPVSEFNRKFLVQDVRKAQCLSTVQIELTPLCNFTCPFCYARRSPEELKTNGEHVLRFEEWKPILDGLAEMKVFYITLSGGECTLHPDFEQIYRYAYSLGFEISLMSNGSAITTSILKMLHECPPKAITVTMYGGCPETYKAVCGNADYYERVKSNLRALKENKINFAVQTTVSKDNIDDIVNIRSFVEELDVPYQIFTDFIKFRHCDGDAIEKNTPDKQKFQKISDIVFGVHGENADKFERKYYPKELPIIEKGLLCAAGRSSCAFNYRGEMQICVTSDIVRIDTKGRKIADCWSEIAEYCRNIPCITECQNCIHKTQCRSCFELHYNDTHEFGKPSPRLCYKKLYPENAKAIEAFYEKNGYIPLDMYNYEK